MKYKVRVDDEEFDVEIPNLHIQPVIAIVDGQTFEVWLDSGMPQREAVPATAGAATSAETVPSRAETPAPAKGAANQVLAPIPGVITAIAVGPGDQVSVGDTLCMLEAMKMNNAIRANREGTIGQIFITVGQHVKHHDVLMEFAE